MLSVAELVRKSPPSLSFRLFVTLSSMIGRATRSAHDEAVWHTGIARKPTAYHARRKLSYYYCSTFPRKTLTVAPAAEHTHHMRLDARPKAYGINRQCGLSAILSVITRAYDHLELEDTQLVPGAVGT